MLFSQKGQIPKENDESKFGGDISSIMIEPLDQEE
jgi:hypothetical protein